MNKTLSLGASALLLVGAATSGFYANKSLNSLNTKRAEVFQAREKLRASSIEVNQYNEEAKQLEERKTAARLIEGRSYLLQAVNALSYNRALSGFWKDEWNNGEKEVSISFSGPVTITIEKKYDYEGKDQGEVRVHYTIPETLPRQLDAKNNIKSALEILSETERKYSKGSDLATYAEVDIVSSMQTNLSPFISPLRVIGEALPSYNGIAEIDGEKVDNSYYEVERETLTQTADRVKVLASDFERVMPSELKQSMEKAQAEKREKRSILNRLEAEEKSRKKAFSNLMTSSILSTIFGLGFGLSSVFPRRRYYV